MKKSQFLISLFLALVFTACASCSIKHKVIEPDVTPTQPSVVLYDTIYVAVADTAELVRLNDELDTLRDSIFSLQNSIKFYRDSVDYINFRNANIVEKVKYYVSICEKKTTNKKFFFGWIKRTLTE